MARKSEIVAAILCAILSASACAPQTPNASDETSLTITGSVCYGSSYLLRNVPVYLFTWEQSSKIRESMRTLERRIHSPGSDDIKIASADGDFYDQVDRLVKKLPNAAEVKSAHSGLFRFSGVASGVRYLIVTEFDLEDGIHFGARSTAILKPGQKPRLDVMITTEPWQMEEGDCSKATYH